MRLSSNVTIEEIRKNVEYKRCIVITSKGASMDTMYAVRRYSQVLEVEVSKVKNITVMEDEEEKAVSIVMEELSAQELEEVKELITKHRRKMKSGLYGTGR